jgi:Concanavalin A-like lectin/glucanases superfamily
MKKATIAVLLVLGGVALAQPVDDHTMAYWKMNEGSGNLIADSSSNGNDGTAVNTVWTTDAKSGGAALQFNGQSSQVDVPDSPTLHPKTGDITVEAWIKVFSDPKNWSIAGAIVFKGNAYQWDVNTDGGLWFGIWGGAVKSTATYDFEQHLNEWHHVAATFDSATQKAQIYVDGELNIEGTAAATIDQSSNDLYIGYKADDGGWFDGIIDEVSISNIVRTQDEIKTSMQGTGGYPFAQSPNPPDGSIHENSWVNLSWKPGDFAVSHDVYLGESFDDVNDATHESPAFRGNQTTTFYVAGFPGFAYPNGLVPGTTYYWRIDEVNGADPNSPWKGKVWSFLVPSLKAYNPDPADGAKFISPDVTLTWTAGLGTKLHYVYFGDDPNTVANATGASPQADATYSPGALELDKTYYWRVDEFDGATTHKGDVWSFTVKPSIPVTDPGLLCWWTLNEGSGRNVLDWSGHGHDATFTGDPQWVDGYDGSALNFNGSGQSVIYNFANDETWTAYTLAVWAKADMLWQSNNSSICATYLTTAGGFQISFDASNNYQYHAGVDQIIGPASLGWVHLAVSYDGTTATAYYNGNFVATFTPAANDLLANKFAIGVNRAEDNWFDGSIDDFRVYNRALSQEEVQLVMRIDPLLAWAPNPANGSVPDIDHAVPLTWTAGDKASQHDVYFGTDKAAVADANASDVTGIYRGRQNGTSYTPPEGVEWGGGPYYWRIDESNNDGTLTKGEVWSFTVADFVLIDDFESYNAGANQIWYSWHDGLGYGVPGTPPYFAGNGTGAAVGDETTASYTEETIVHGGRQSMPLWYDNNKQGFAKYSETEFKLTSPRDWSKHGISELSLWFRGYPASVGSFVEAPVGTYTMTASGADIWGTADQFHYAYKTLTGAGSIIAKVQSVANTNAWSKAGVMIRETLDAGSRQALVCVTPGNGVAFQYRTDTDATSSSTNQTGLVAPYWVKLERDAAGNFTASASANGTTWEPIATAVPQNIPMSSMVYIGLALTSHDVAQTCQAVFSNVTTTGTVSAQWADQDIGIANNAPEPLYVAVSNATGQPAVVTNPDPNAATTDTWTQWEIPLSQFSDQGIDLTNVDQLAIGLGTPGNMTVPGGSGKMYFDDIRLLRPPTTP